MISSKIFVPLLILNAIAGNAIAQNHIKVFSETSIVWYGVDYSLSKFTLVNRSGAQIVDTYIPSINALIVQDKQYDIGKFFNKNSVTTELDNVNTNNQKINPSKLVINSPNSITIHEVENLIDSYNNHGKTGMGLVFVAENMNKATSVGSFYVCFFDLATNEIIDSQRMESKAVGVGFRNFWASTVYAVMKDWSPRK